MEVDGRFFSLLSRDIVESEGRIEITIKKIFIFLSFLV